MTAYPTMPAMHDRATLSGFTNGCFSNSNLKGKAMKTIVGSFDSFAEASHASAQLVSAGFMQNDINIISNNTGRAGTTDNVREAETAPNDDSGVTTGALTGGAIGGAAGVAISLMGLAVPGIGPILAAGALATALAGAGAGAVAGGLIGALTDMGVSDEDAHYYAESVRRGGALLTVQADNVRSVQVESILKDSGAVNVEERVESWRDKGWKGFDSDSTPYSYDQIEQERARNRTMGSGPKIGL